MIHFRKMKLEDLDLIYKDAALRTLITVPPKGEKFALLIDEEGKLLGGVTGYIEGELALIQKTVILPMEQREAYKDGLIRSLIHILELDGTLYLFTTEEDPLYGTIGFTEYQESNWHGSELGSNIMEDLHGNTSRWIDLKEFFRQ